MRNRLCAALLIAALIIPTSTLAQSASPQPAAAAPAGAIRDAMARAVTQAAAGPKDAKAEWQARYDRAKSLKQTGIVVFALGAAALVGGVIWEFAVEFSSTANPDAAAPKVTLIAGVAGIAAGLPMWLVGRHNMYDAEQGLATAGGTQTATLLQLDDHHAVTVSARNGTVVGYRLSW